MPIPSRAHAPSNQRPINHIAVVRGGATSKPRAAPSTTVAKRTTQCPRPAQGRYTKPLPKSKDLHRSNSRSQARPGRHASQSSTSSSHSRGSATSHPDSASGVTPGSSQTIAPAPGTAPKPKIPVREPTKEEFAAIMEKFIPGYRPPWTREMLKSMKIKKKSQTEAVAPGSTKTL